MATHLSSTDDLSEVADLQRGAARLVTMSAGERLRLLRECVIGVERHWQQWCEEAWAAKRIPAGDAARAEDMMTAVLPTVRHLQLLRRTLQDILTRGRPHLPTEPYERRGRLLVPVFPTCHLFDRLLFRPIRAHVQMAPGTTREGLFGENLKRVIGEANDPPGITLVLGAGNVSSIPITDALTKIFQENQAVLLKMNPVNAYVGPIFEQAFTALIDAGLLRIVYGGPDAGATWVADREIARIHVTGSHQTHDQIVWGNTPQEQADRKATDAPLLKKPITSELGNVSPWIIVPGHYSDRQLRFQAENIVASVTNNASFLCIATKMLITWRNWPQREKFLNLIDAILSAVPRRFAYYPGASERFARFSRISPDDPERLPWTLRRDLDPVTEPLLFQEESFACVFGETSIGAQTPSEFLMQAVDFANNAMWGTLSAALSAPDEFQRASSGELDRAVDELRYGTVGINIWPGVAFALMSTPWGAFPDSGLQDIQSGVGTVHNTYLLEYPEKTILRAPLSFRPKPLWFSTHRCPESLARALIKLTIRPGVGRLLPVLLNALRG